MAPFLRRNEWFSILIVIFLIIFLVIGNNYGLTKVSDISTLYTSLLFSGIISVLIWDFKARFEKDKEAIAKVEDDLRTHYKGIIDRMATWEYQPNVKGNIINNPGGVQPLSLKEDLEHLRMFEDAWRLYNDGPDVHKRFNTADIEANKIIEGYLDTMINSSGLSFINWPTNKLIKEFASVIINKVGWELKAKNIDDFVVTALNHIGSYNFEGKTQSVQQFVSILNTIKQRKDVREAIEKKIKTSDEMEKNKIDFINTLKYKVISQVVNSVYTDQRLRNGVCDDCKYLKEKLNSLIK